MEYPQKPVGVAHSDLGAEFYRRDLLPPDYRTYPGLTETDDPVEIESNVLELSASVDDKW